MAYLLKKFCVNHAVLGTVAALLLTTGVAAQTVGDTTTLPSVVVTERSPHPVADVTGLGDTPLERAPLSATVIDAQRIEASGARRLADLYQFDASISDAYNAVGYWDYATVRGYVLDNKFNYRRDGLPINAETFVPLDNKEAVELLKGTSGMQAGVSAPGGLVQYVVKRPTDAPMRTLRLEGLSTGAALLSADLAGRWGSHNEFGYRLNVAGEALKSDAPGTNGSRQLLALALDWRITRDTLLRAEAEYSRRSQPSVPGLSLTGDTLPSPNPRININSQSWSLPVVLQGATGSMRLEQALGSDWRWMAQAGSQRLRSDDRAAFPFGCSQTGQYDRYCPNGDFDLYDYRSENEHRTTDAAQLQLSGRVKTGSVQHQMQLGWLGNHTQDHFGRAAYNWVGTGNVSALQPVPPDPSLTTDNTQRNEHSQELFAMDALTWNEQIKTWLGLRHTRLERSSASTDGTQAPAYTQSLSTPWAAVSYQLTPQHMVYGSWGQGVESQVVPNRPDQFTNFGQALKPVVSHQSEWGIKAQDQALNWQLAYFSIVRPATNLDACNRLYIAPCEGQYDGSARHSGVEGSAQWRGGVWSLGGGFTVLHARREGSLIEPAVNGQRPANVPDFILRAQTEYRVSALPGLKVQATLSQEGPRAVLPTSSVTLPSWTRTDAAVRYESALLGTTTTWTLGVNNLLNRRYFQESPYQFGHVYLFPAAARQIRISMQTSL